jgi:hypothetical protein
MLQELVGTLDAVLLESNYDPAKLAGGPYPQFLRQRIAGTGVHLSNGEAANLLKSAPKGQLRWACLGHLSEQNNTAELALRAHRHVLGPRFPLSVASRYEVQRRAGSVTRARVKSGSRPRTRVTFFCKIVTGYNKPSRTRGPQPGIRLEPGHSDRLLDALGCDPPCPSGTDSRGFGSEDENRVRHLPVSRERLQLLVADSD